MFLPKEALEKVRKHFKEFLPTTGLTYMEYVALDQLSKDAINQAFRSWLRAGNYGKEARFQTVKAMLDEYPDLRRRIKDCLCPSKG